MIIFGTNKANNRGCFYSLRTNLNPTAGAIMELPVPDGDDARFPNNTSYNVLVIGINFDQKESMSLQKCFNDVNYIYTFGHDIGDITVTFLLFLKAGKQMNGLQNASSSTSGDKAKENDPNRTDQDAVQQILNIYNNNRIYAAKKQVSVSFGGTGTALTGYLTHMSSSTFSNEFNIQQFTFSLMATKLQGVATE